MTGSAAPALLLSRSLVDRILALCAYVGDHGGGSREHIDGNGVPYTPTEKCPSCEANAIGLAITMEGTDAE